MKARKAQVSVEYIILVGVLLIVLIPLFYYSLTNASEKVKLSQAENTILTLAKTVSEVTALSPGTKKYATISIPGGVQSTMINGSEITLTFIKGGKNSDYTSVVRAIVVGNIPTQKGIYRIPVELLESGVVQIGSADDIIPPIVVSTSPNGLVCNPITIQANTNEAATCKYDTLDTNYETMRYTLNGNTLNHNVYLGIQNQGTYVYYVRCRDAFGNTMDSSTSISYQISYDSCGGQGTINETIPPIVTLLNPIQGYESNTTLIHFYYNVTDDSTIILCKLFMNSTLAGTAILPSRNITNDITASLNKGNYLWSINCTDSSGNEGNSSTRIIRVNATLDADNPFVNLVLPLNGSIQKLSTVKFSYNVTDLTSNIGFCTLQAYGILDTGTPSSQSAVQFNVPEGSRQNITMSFDKGNFTWNMTCVDNSVYFNTGVSETRNLRVNVSAETTVITSCAGRCWSEGYSDGVCRQEQPKCDQNGEIYVSSGDVYCTGGSQSDTCCCKP